MREEPGIWAQGGAAVAGAQWWVRWRDSEASLSSGAGRAVPAGQVRRKGGSGWEEARQNAASTRERLWEVERGGAGPGGRAGDSVSNREDSQGPRGSDEREGF